MLRGKRRWEGLNSDETWFVAGRSDKTEGQTAHRDLMGPRGFPNQWAEPGESTVQCDKRFPRPRLQVPRSGQVTGASWGSPTTLGGAKHQAEQDTANMVHSPQDGLRGALLQCTRKGQ